MAPPPTAAAPALIEQLGAAGLVAPAMVIREAKRSGLRLELACALLEKESSGGHNVYGHDPTIFAGAGAVTRTNYVRYKRQRIASRNRSMQGVGPCQLTWWELQDAADAQGGCWRPEINMRTGFGHLAALVKRYGESEGARRYNGTGDAAEAYSRDLLARTRRWETIIDGQDAPAVARPARAVRRDAPGKGEAERNGRAGRAAAPRPGRPRVGALADEVRRRDEAADRAWRRLVAAGHRRRRALHAAKASIQDGHDGTDDDAMKKLLEALARIEGRLGTLVDVTIHKPELPPGGPTPMESAAAAAAQPAAAEPASEGPAPAPSAAVKPLAEYSVPELLREVEALETGRRRLRDELIERYERADEQLAKLRGEPRPAEERDGDGDRPRRKRRRPDDGAASRSERDPQGGRTAITRLGDRGRFVRRSKIALSRYLAKAGSSDHAALRRRLRREAATPRTGDVASPAWGKAVEAAQHVAGRPVTGELDGELTQILLPFWPRDHVAKRMVRSTPAWRAIPGQLTPNFNVKELACKDPARTPYVKGLMRGEGLSKGDARRRAKGVAQRLERLRRLGGDRPIVVTSAFRTKAYNATLPGAATNSAHTRGFAVDTPPPRGISLLQHRQHVLQSFECGVGYYPAGRGYFVHGDFDPTLGRRTW